MFESLESLSLKLRNTGYFIDPVMTMDIFLAGKLRKPVILEGPAGSGKTQLALAVAKAASTHVERLQCYEGLTDKQAIGEFDEGLQRLYMEFCKGQGLGWHEIVHTLKGRDFFRPGPLMRALECDRPCVLLIDEIDKVDYAFEAMLLELLSGWTLSIPKMGTIHATSIPYVFLTSNQERRLGDPLRRRSFYLVVEHPTAEREAAIVAKRTPAASEKTHRFIAGLAKSLRAYTMEKPPSISEMNDVALAMQVLGIEQIRPEHKDIMLPLIAKTEGDRKRLLMKQAFESIVRIAGRYASEISPEEEPDLNAVLGERVEI
jgi:MoxR-like ATPase